MSEIRKLGASDLEFATGGTDAEETTVSPGGHTVTKFDAGHLNMRGIARSVESQLRFRGALVYRTTNQTLPDNTVTTILFDAESYDTDSIHSTSSNTGRLTVPSGVTYVKLVGQVYVGPGANVVTTVLDLYKNGTQTVGTVPGCMYNSHALSGGDYYFKFSTAVLSVTAGDYFEVKALQNSDGSGSTTSESTWFSMEIVE